tara:strand:- start:294 stop:773 length:480 start_codon:yes stop_codon:yes gene_type:complete
MIKNYKVVNNYLSPGLFKSIKNRLVDPSVPFYKSEINNNDDLIYFSHRIFTTEDYSCSFLFNEIKPIVTTLLPKALIRVKLNYYPKNNTLNKHSNHTDFTFSHKGAIFSLNTCDGGTYIGKDFIPSVENTMLLFDPSVQHCSTDTTTKEGRYNINFNYL